MDRVTIKRLLPLSGYDSVEQFEDYVAYIDERDGLWYWSAGEDGDVCIVCDRDLSDTSDILVNYDFPCSRAMCSEHSD